jgi:hypothetical protein
VSHIPSAAVSSSLTPISRQTNDAVRARQVQMQKNAHHAEDIEELNDSGVDSINDHPQQKEKRDQPEGEGEEQALEEKVEIASLKKQAAPAKGIVSQKVTRLDISA